MKGVPRVFQKQLRRKISGHRTRFKEGGFDLDMSYITDRIIAMGMPAEGLKSAWRNPIDEVAKMLDEYHKGTYLIYNLSDQRYDYSRFSDAVVEFPFPDHYAPPLSLLFHVVLSVDKWLRMDDHNVVAIHCKGGKGRTGVIIACYLIFNEEFKMAKEALEFFAERRSSTGRGVTQPSQIRYVQYFQTTLVNSVAPASKRISVRTISMSPVPTRTYGRGNGIRPVIRIFSTERYPKLLIYASHMETRRYSSDVDESMDWKFREGELELEEDVLIKIYHEQRTNKRDRKKMLRVSFNTSFVPGNYLSVPLDQIDQPGNKDFLFPANFALNIHFNVVKAKPAEGIRSELRSRSDSVPVLPERIISRNGVGSAAKPLLKDYQPGAKIVERGDGKIIETSEPSTVTVDVPLDELDADASAVYRRAFKVHGENAARDVECIEGIEDNSNNEEDISEEDEIKE